MHNLILLIFKFHIYKSRVSGSLIFKAFFHKLVRIKNPEMGTVLRNQRKLDKLKNYKVIKLYLFFSELFHLSTVMLLLLHFSFCFLMCNMQMYMCVCMSICVYYLLNLKYVSYCNCSLSMK